MAISEGDKIPEATFHVMTDDGPAKMTTGELLSGKKVVLFAVPGAFTPTCHVNHLPGFVENLAAFKEKGVDEIAVTGVNDIHVMNAWADASGAKGRIKFLSDGNGDFAKAIGMDIDLGIAGMGVRSKRYSMIIDDGTVKKVNVEDVPSEAKVSSAATLLGQL